MTRTTSRRAGIGLVIALLLVVAACTSSDETTTPSATTVASIPSEAASPVPSKGAETTSATCEEITRFGETVVSTGITYDYTPSTSPAALAEQSEVVVVGTTTGDAELIPGESASDLVVAITVEVDEVLRSTLPEPLPPTIEVRVPVSNDGFGSRTINATVEGIPVVAFLTSARGGLVPQIEGLVTACDAPPLLGAVGFQGSWATIDSLDELLEQLRG